MGRQLVIVGNGPSLNAHMERGDFELLRSVPTIAMNEIDRLYERTKWRPDWWVFVEQLGPEWAEGRWAPKVLDAHILPGVERCVVDLRFRPELLKVLNARGVGMTDNVRWVTRSTCPHYGQLDEQSVTPAGWHLPEWCAFGGAITGALHLALILGYTDVAVIGCDLGIGKDPDHFDPGYYSYPDGDRAKQDDTLRHAHALARVEFARRFGRIVNAGIGGELETHPRMDLRRWLDD